MRLLVLPEGEAAGEELLGEEEQHDSRQRDEDCRAASTVEICAPPYVLCMPARVVTIGRTLSDWLSVRPSSRSFQMKVACRMKIATSALDAIGR